MAIFKIWYSKPEHVGDALCGAKPATNMSTHVLLKTIDLPDDRRGPVRSGQLDRIYHMGQGEVWSPNGEARPLIESKGLNHTSMCVGDVIEDDEGDFYLVANVGFTNLKFEGWRPEVPRGETRQAD